jgi:hypothetical protein
LRRLVALRSQRGGSFESWGWGTVGGRDPSCVRYQSLRATVLWTAKGTCSSIPETPDSRFLGHWAAFCPACSCVVMCSQNELST